jgi:protein involved in polysaccharide export with SLBB domain
MRLRNTLVVLAAAGLLAGAGQARAQAVDRVNPGDQLQVVVYAGGEKQEDFMAVVTPDTTITCPLLGIVKVAESGTAQIAADLVTAYGHGYYVDPQVLVTVKETGGKIYVLGEVRNPGIFLLRDGPTALSACVLAGGFTDFAAPRQVKVMRVENGKPKVIKVDLTRVKRGKARDLTLRDGDRLEVPRRLF